MSSARHALRPAQEKRDKRFEHIAWGLFLIMIGGLWIVPDRMIPEGAWLVGAGAIMLGLNAARYVSGIRMSTFSIVLGVFALAAGISDMAGVELPVLALIVVLCGATIVYHAATDRADQAVE
jgi:hypothetical protein